MATASDLIEHALDFLHGGQAEEVNVLTSGIDADDTSVTVDYSLDGIVPGALIAIDLEVFRVMETNATSNSATVLRAQRGSAAAAHSAGAVVQVAPRFSRWSVFRAINDELDTLSSEGLFQMATVELTYNASVMSYDLTSVTSVEDIYSVRYEVPGPSKEWPLLHPSKYRFERNANTTDFASGFSLTLYGDNAYNGKKVRVAYRAPFTRFSTSAQDAQTYAGLPATANDIPPLGAAIRLLAGHEAGRIAYDSQPDTRRPDEVPAGAQIQTVSGWRSLRERRVHQERARLSKKYPMRRG